LPKPLNERLKPNKSAKDKSSLSVNAKPNSWKPNVFVRSS
jgi:hypothetical protein